MAREEGKLEQLLRSERYTLAEVARAIDVNWQTLRNWDAKKAPIGKLWAIHEYTKIPINRILACYIPIHEEQVPPVEEAE
jgi:hypothetical protein